LDDTSLKPDTIFARFFSKHFQDSGFWLFSSQEKNIIATAAVEGCGTKAISDIHRYSAYWWLRECEFRLDDLDYEILHKSVGRQTGADR